VRAVANTTPKVSCWAASRLDRHGRAKVDLIVGPGVDLRLIDEHGRVAEAEVTRPGVGRRRRIRRLREGAVRQTGNKVTGKRDGYDNATKIHG
jgi:hypothetical protein